MNLQLPREFGIIPETDEFLKLWPHRFDYIYSPQGLKPDWRTESRHPLGDRLIMEGLYHYGIRFGGSTSYIMIDIDSDSRYHPNQDSMALGRIMTALAPAGFLAKLACTSSYSGGIHLYLPWNGAINTWTVANAIDALLRSNGFIIAPGVLEIFPNRKTSAATLYNAHRLPMSQGSYMLNDGLDYVVGDREEFARRWDWIAERNLVRAANLEAIARRLTRHSYKLTQSATKFLGDLDAEIEVGWTGPGQTNKLLGRIALRGYCFGHIIEGEDPLHGHRLEKYICQTARLLPGFSEFCGHQREIETKAKFWARSVEASARYFPYAVGKRSQTEIDRDRELGNPWNVLQMQLARLRIKEALAELLGLSTLPATARSRLEALMEFGIAADTLYRHKDLWHPNYLNDPSPMDIPEEKMPTSLLGRGGWITFRGKRSSPNLAKSTYKQGGSTGWDGDSGDPDD
jgi:hypothetical protein